MRCITVYLYIIYIWYLYRLNYSGSCGSFLYLPVLHFSPVPVHLSRQPCGHFPSMLYWPVIWALQLQGKEQSQPHVFSGHSENIKQQLVIHITTCRSKSTASGCLKLITRCILLVSKRVMLQKGEPPSRDFFSSEIKRAKTKTTVHTCESLV